MIYTPSALAIAVFLLFVGVTLGISFHFGKRAKSSAGYFAAHGQIPWFVNGIAFAGDYLSAASFLGICGMISLYGYDGFLYSIGYLAGWIVALFVVAEPMKRLGKFTFADALDAKFQSRGIKFMVGISTLAVSVFYLIPQMVGAGALVRPLLGLPHWAGVLLVGTTVIIIVVTAGMVSTTWVQFLKGSLLVVFSVVLTALILSNGLKVRDGGLDGHHFATISLDEGQTAEEVLAARGYEPVEAGEEWAGFIRTLHDESGQTITFKVVDERTLTETQTLTDIDGRKLVNGLPLGIGEGETQLHNVGWLASLPGGATETGPLTPVEFFQTLEGSEVVTWPKPVVIDEGEAGKTTVYSPSIVSGSDLLRPGRLPDFAGLRSGNTIDRINFVSLMLALFCGTASLPHILIRYYTVKDEAAARKSTIVGIGAIGFFYILTLFMGLGAMTSGALDLTDSNMAAPLLAKSIADWLFAVISAIAFTTVLGTVSGLILASAGAVTHDVISNAFRVQLTDSEKVRVAKIASVAVGALAIVLGILFQGMNVNYLVGWAFSVAASANLPSLVMVLFWKGVTKQGIVAAVSVGMVSSLTWILLSADTFQKVYGVADHRGYVPFSQPGLVTIPLGFLTLVGVSLLTKSAKAQSGNGPLSAAT